MLEINGDLLRLGLSGGDDGYRGDDDDNLMVMLKIVVIHSKDGGAPWPWCLVIY